MLKKWIKVRTISLHICQHCLWIWTGGPWSDMYVLFTCWGWGVRSCVCVWVCERSEGAGVRAGICLPRLLRAVTVWCDVRCRPVLTPRRHTVLLWRTFSSVTHGTVCRDVLRVWRKTILGQLKNNVEPACLLSWTELLIYIIIKVNKVRAVRMSLVIMFLTDRTVHCCLHLQRRLVFVWNSNQSFIAVWLL